MSRSRSRIRQGFTLAEILIAVVILGIIGAALVRLLISQSRFTELQMSKRNARTVSRNAMNIMLTDLRMVQDSGGLRAAANDYVTARVPIAFGLFCGTNGGNYSVSLLPVDSAMTALGKYGGWAYRDPAQEVYVYKDASTPIAFNSLTTGSAGTCTGAGISQVTVAGRTGRVVQFNEAPSGGAPTDGVPVMVYQIVTYRFDNSTAFSGRRGLFRIVADGTPGGMRDEIIAPFDTAAKFRFYVLNEDTAQTAVPADLRSVRGLQLYLAGSSPRVPQGGDFAQAALVTGVFFKNRRDP